MIVTTPSSEDTSSVSLNVLTYLDTLTNSTEDQCFSARSRSSVLQGLPFGGVPTVLALNFLLWMVSEKEKNYLPLLFVHKSSPMTAGNDRQAATFGHLGKLTFCIFTSNAMHEIGQCSPSFPNIILTGFLLTCFLNS